MALSIDIELKNSGITANYIAIDSILSTRELNGDRYASTICFGIYKDAEARATGKDPIDTHSIVVEGKGFVESIIALGYAELKKTMPGATDV